MKKLILVITEFFCGPKHRFNLDKPITDQIRTTYTVGSSGIRKTKEFKITGFKCEKCDYVLWLERRQMLKLPTSMEYGCPEI